LGNFGPLGESYEESEALAEPLADETSSESLAESQDEPVVVEQPPALYGAPADVGQPESRDYPDYEPPQFSYNGDSVVAQASDDPSRSAYGASFPA